MSWITAWWQQVSETVADGLQITVVGMSLVFLTLGLIIVALILLTQLPGLKVSQKGKEQDLALESSPQETAASVAADAIDTDAELARVAAIAVALLRSRPTEHRRRRSETAGSRWKQYSRAHQLGL